VIIVENNLFLFILKLLINIFILRDYINLLSIIIYN
jgi:hypothetical protein